MIKKLVILAGGKGTRFLEETFFTPKPMINIGGLPIILHIMKYYSFFGVKSVKKNRGHFGGNVSKSGKFEDFLRKFEDFWRI